jgi:2,3-bisphosphoglycerate-independent phosphoglycerate mutase
VADEAVKRIESGKYDVMILNFANPDMVGHTGVMEAATAAVHAVDACVGKSGGSHPQNGRALHHYGGPRQLREDVGRRGKRAVYRAYDESRALHPCRRYP